MNRTDAHRILLVEDDRDLGEVVTLHLQGDGFEVVAVHGGREGLSAFANGRWDLVVLDWMLPGLSGLEVLQAIRAKDVHTPILMLTARGEESDKVMGLELGCDDYMTKPFGLKELSARIRVLLRRLELTRAVAEGADRDETLDFGDLRIEPSKRKVMLNDEPVALTLKEFELLMQMAAKPGRTFSRRQLLDLVWDRDADVYEHTVNSHVNRLRGKIEANPNRPRYIQTVWGIGYRFTEDF